MGDDGGDGGRQAAAGAGHGFGAPRAERRRPLLGVPHAVHHRRLCHQVLAHVARQVAPFLFIVHRLVGYVLVEAGQLLLVLIQSNAQALREFVVEEDAALKHAEEGDPRDYDERRKDSESREQVESLVSPSNGVEQREIVTLDHA